MQQGRRSVDGRQCLNAWRRLENKSQGIGCERKSEEEEVQSEILDHQAMQGLPIELHESGWSRSCYEQVWCQHERGVHAVRMALTERFKIEEVDGSSSGQKEHDLAVLTHGSIWP